MNGNSKTGWIIAGILAVVVVIMLFMMWNHNNSKDLGNVLEEGRTSIIDMRAEIEKKCEGPQANEQECQDALDDLAEVLEDFSEDVDKASTTSPTTTPQ